MVFYINYDKELFLLQFYIIQIYSHARKFMGNFEAGRKNRLYENKNQQKRTPKNYF